MKLNLSARVVEYLEQNPEQKFTAREIAEWVFENYPDECRQKQERSKATVYPINDDASLVQQLIAEIGTMRPGLQEKNPKIKTTEGRPRKYYFTESTDSAEIDNVERDDSSLIGKVSGSKVKEQDLYPVLSQFLEEEHKIHSKRINEKRSRNTKGPSGNEWLHPDIVGMENLSEDWHREVKECVKHYTDKKTKLWSFEVKTLINRSNVRKSFFQAVSNSSWANFGYLVASEITGDDALKELRILSSLHGIGFIRLDVDNPSESEIMIPAKERSDIDWDTANRLTEENEEFLDYIKSIRKFYQTGEVENSDWDIKIDQD